MALAFLLCALAWFVDPAAFDPLRWKTSLLLALAPIAFLASMFAGKLKHAAVDALPRAFLALAFLLLWALAGAICKVDPPALASRPIAVLALLLIVAVLAWFEGFDHPLRLPFAALLAGVPLALLCIAQALGHDPVFDQNAKHEAVATFGNTNAAGEFLAPLVPLALGLALGAGGSASWVGRFALPLLACGVILTGSRGAALAAVLACVIVAWYAARRFAPNAKARFVPALVALACGAVLPLVLVGPDAYAFKSADDAPQGIAAADYRPNVQRLLLAQSAWTMAKDAPIAGFGPGQFEARFPIYRNPEEARLPTAFGMTSEAEDPHDLYLLLLCEGGVPALAAFLLFMGAALASVRAARVLPAADPRNAIVLGVFGALLAVLVVGVFRGVLSNPALTALAFALAGTLLAYYDGRSADPIALRIKGAIALVALLVCVCVLGVRGLVGDLYFRSAAKPPGSLGLETLDRDLARAMDWDPTNVDALEFRGAMLTQYGTLAKHAELARTTWEALLAQRPHAFAAHLGLAELDARAGRSDSAWSHLRHVQRLREGSIPKERAALLATLETSGRDAAFAALLADAYAHAHATAAQLDAAAKAREQGTPTQRAAAATLLFALAARAPWNGDLAYRRGQVLESLDDGRSVDAFHRAHLAYAMEHLQDGQVADARRSLKLAARYGAGPEHTVLDALCDAAEHGSADVSAAKTAWSLCGVEFRERVLLLDTNPELGPAIAALAKS